MANIHCIRRDFSKLREVAMLLELNKDSVDVVLHFGELLMQLVE